MSAESRLALGEAALRALTGAGDSAKDSGGGTTAGVGCGDITSTTKRWPL